MYDWEIVKTVIAALTMGAIVWMAVGLNKPQIPPVVNVSVPPAVVTVQAPDIKYCLVKKHKKGHKHG